MIKQWLVLILSIAATIALAACGSAQGGSGNAPAGPADGGGPVARMGNTTFDPPSAAIRAGQSLTLAADTFVPHVIANGTWQDGRAKPMREPGAPAVSELNIPGNGSGTVGPFAQAGTYQLYCTIHPNMNLTVQVT